jgi:hypothetical protein
MAKRTIRGILSVRKTMTARKRVLVWFISIALFLEVWI